MVFEWFNTYYYDIGGFCGDLVTINSFVEKWGYVGSFVLLYYFIPYEWTCSFYLVVLIVINSIIRIIYGYSSFFNKGFYPS